MLTRLTRPFRNRRARTALPAAGFAGKVLEVRRLEHLQKALSWTRDPLLDESSFGAFRYLPDLNDRPLRDAEVVATACRNADGGTVLEIGTGLGYMTALMAVNAPHSIIHTVNLPPEEAREGGSHITFAPAREEIGSHYRKLGLKNVDQILVNTAHWTPPFESLDVAFIDGCHDASFVYNDTVAVLERCRAGSILLWHDFAPGLRQVYPWIDEVCRGIERLYQNQLLSHPILHLQDSWVGLYRV